MRIHFSGDDFARLRLITRPDPLWEVVLSSHLLQARETPIFDPWRQHARWAARSTKVRQAIEVIGTVNPRCTYFPDFLTPTPDGQGIEAGVDAVLHTPAQRVRRELETLSGLRDLSPWARSLADGDLAAVGLLGDSLITYHRALVQPFTSRIRARVDGDRTVRARALMNGGVDALLASLRPTLRWRSPVLEADFPSDQDLHLNGRGLVLVPSFFCWRTPVTMADPDLTPVLVYPAVGDPTCGPAAAQLSNHALVALLGTTRATVLNAVSAGGGATTGELARTIGVSAATASEHTKVLREAGLLTSIRNANSVLHAVTPLGSALLAPHR
ncbi:helix-turn-helix domain-containing protein [Fodinicola feengrottensis]|uniref:ArsR/SmtB family transcription factor n=1 Tax=Fodinicola feengrottensis TaxID=435914 RepID=UPI0031D27A54